MQIYNKYEKNRLFGHMLFVAVIIILFSFIPVYAQSQESCEDINPPQYVGQGNSQIVAGSGGQIYINGFKCNQVGNSDNYDCGNVGIVNLRNDTFIVSENDCEWQILDGDWDKPIPVEDELLPVDLLYFTAEQCDNNICIYWTTATEINNHYFIIERSYDLIDFDEVAMIMGNGNSSFEISYSFIDSDISKNDVYYRLIQVDYDGTTKVYDVIYVDYTLNNSIALEVFPNPVQDLLTVRVKENGQNDYYRINIYNSFGKLVRTEVVTGRQLLNDYQLNFSDLYNDQYFIEVVAGDEKVFNTRVVKM